MLFITLLPAGAQKNIPASDIKTAMMKATRFMVEKVSNRGGYLWNYSPDFSRCWGELEAKPSMIWIEAGTPAMGNVFLNAYQLTGESYYLKAAQAAADALIWGQHSSGGWPYMLDFSGETSLKQWYSKVQKGYIHCAQEHAHYYGNCTYDDAATYDSGMFLLRMYLLTLDPKYKYPVERCLDFVLESQYPIGGWPQRYPLHYEYVKGDKEDYTSFITINDGVHTNNINFLLACYTLLGEVSPSEGEKSKRKHDPFYVTGTSSENLLAYGMLPESRLIDQEKMQKTLVRAAQNWNWSGGSWSWNYPTLAMNATRLLQPEIALRAITMDNREDLLLPSGNNYRSTRLRSYLPGNGGLLLAVSMMCAGWDGCSVSNPGFPKDGKWNVRWEGLHPMP